MIDSDDVFLWAAFGPVGGWVLTTIFVVVLAFLGWRACDNNTQCKRQHCEAGRPVLVKGDCVCVGEALP